MYHLTEDSPSPMEGRVEKSAILCAAFLVLVTAWTVLVLSPAVTVMEDGGWDNSFHCSITAATERILREDPRNLFDSWFDEWNLGFPIFHYYQHAPYIIMAALHTALPSVPLHLFFNISIVALIALFPLACYGGARMAGFDRPSSLAAALLCNLVRSTSLFGMEPDSYIRVGVYTQLWASVLFPLAFGASTAAIREGKRRAPAVVLTALTVLSHSLLGVMLLISLTLVPIADRLAGRGSRGAWARTLELIFLAAGATSYWWVPMALTATFVTPEPWIGAELLRSYGPIKALGNLVSGRLLDYARFPFITLLVFAGLVLAVLRRSGALVLAGCGFLSALVLFFGAPGPAALLHLLPLLRNFPLERFVFMVHFFAVLLAAAALGEILAMIRLSGGSEAPALPGIMGTGSSAKPSSSGGAPAVAAVLLIMLVPLADMWPYCRMRISNLQGYRASESYRSRLLHAFDMLKKLLDGRVLTWGRDDHCIHYVSGLTPLKTGKPVIYGLSAATGIHSMGFYYTQFLDRWNPAHFDLFNARWYLSESGSRKDAPFAKDLDSAPVFRIRELRTSGFFGYAQGALALSADRIKAREAVLSWMKGPWLPAGLFVIMREEGFGTQGETPLVEIKADGAAEAHGVLQSWGFEGRSPWKIFDKIPPGHRDGQAGWGRVETEERSLNHYAARVSIRRPGFLLLKTVFHPGWNAAVDGKPVRISTLSPCFMGVYLDKGAHKVEFTYRCSALKLWLLASGAVLVVWLALCDPKRSAAGKTSAVS
jgi:hypothetical protein